MSMAAIQHSSQINSCSIHSCDARWAHKSGSGSGSGSSGSGSGEMEKRD